MTFYFTLANCMSFHFLDSISLQISSKFGRIFLSSVFKVQLGLPAQTPSPSLPTSNLSLSSHGSHNRLSKSSSITISYLSRCLSSAVASEANSPYKSLFPPKPNLKRIRKDPKDRNVQWVFLGCPGVGKGTYASRLCKLLGVPHIATGDLVREELASSDPLSQQRLEVGEAKGESGFILDGFPRTINQAKILDRVTNIDLVVNLKIPEDVLMAKCLGRRICSECSGNFNVASINVKCENGNPGISMAPLLPPPHCMSKLITRADDIEAVVKERLRIYNEKSQPVEDFYRSQGKLLEFDLPGGIPESWPKLLEALNLDDYEEQQAATA